MRYEALRNASNFRSAQRVFVRRAHDKAQVARSTRPVISTVPRPTVSSEDGTKTFRVRQHGNRGLPLPPLMDPIAIEAKERYQQPKAEPDQHMTDLQRELAVNPYAQALATPVRQCKITRARLPSHFLIPFTTVLTPPIPKTHPEVTETTDRTSRAVTSPPRPVLVPQVASELLANRRDRQDVRGVPLGTSSYVLNRSDIVQHLKRRSRWTGIVGQRMQEAYGRAVGSGQKDFNVDKKWVWDEGMVDTVAERLRNDVVRRLRECLQDERRQLILPFEGVNAVEGMMDENLDVKIAAILSLQQPTINDLSGKNWTARLVDKPVYNLAHLFGEDALPPLGSLGQLSALSSLASESSRLAILRYPKGIKLLLALDRLETFLRHSTPSGQAKPISIPPPIA